MFRNAFPVENHINNTIDPSTESQPRRLMGNIGKLLAGNSDIYYTKPLSNSMLGKGYDYVPVDNLITSNNSMAVNSAGLQGNIPKHFHDNSSPLHHGDLGIGISWRNLKKYTPGHLYAHDGSRALNFTFKVEDSSHAPVVPHDPPLKQIISNGKKTVALMSVKELYPTLNNPINFYEN